MTRLLHALFTLVFLVVSTSLFAQPCDCLTTGNCPVPIQDNGTFQGTLDVTVNGANDLGVCPLTSLCFSITHTWVGDLSVTLTSPAGLNYLVMADANNSPGGCGTDADNIEVCILPGTGNPLTNNTEYMCNPGPCFSGTCCLTGNWTMPCGGVTDPFSGAFQSPNCDLNDFNVPGNPANGTWTLTVNDICASDVGFLNNFSLTFACGTSSCVVCEAEGGALNADDVEGCFGDPSLNLNLPPTYNPGPPPPPGEYSYGYVISQNGTIMFVDPVNADLSFQPPGSYEVCGISYLTQAIGDLATLVGMDLTTAQNLLSSTTAPFCADFSDDCINVTIGPAIPPTLLDTMVCLGDCIEVGGQQVCTSGQVTLESYLGCDSIVIVTMIPIFVDPTVEEIPVCQNDCLEIGGEIICPPGGTITYENYQGCDSIVNYILLEEITQAIITPNPPPPLDCNNPVITLDGSASFPIGAVTYEWVGPTGPLGSDPAVFISQPGTYTLTVFNNNLAPPCESTVTVEVTGSQLIPELQLVGPEPSICLGEVFDLSTLNIVDINGTNPTLTFHSDTPATPANQLPSTIVSSTVTTTYFVLGDAAGCTDEIPVTVTVNQVPPPTVINEEVCDGECIEVGGQIFCASGQVTLQTYLGCDSVVIVNIVPIIIPPSVEEITVCEGECVTIEGTVYCPPGPHEIIYESYQGCDSTVTYVLLEEVTQAVIVPANPQPLSCSNQTITLDGSQSVPAGVTLSWEGPSGGLGNDPAIIVDVAGTYTLTVTNNNVSPACTSTTSVEVTGEVEGPDLQVNTQPVICAGEEYDLATLNIVDLNNTDPIITYHSDTPATAANELPSTIVSPTVTTTYYILGTTGACSDEVPVTVTVNPIPTADFTVTEPICLDGSSTVTYTGSAGAGATFNWNFGGGTATPGNGPGPHDVTWTTAGPKTITLIVEENGCTSASFNQTVNVDEPLADPVINCDPTINSILFTWGDVAGADDYTVTVTTGQASTSMPTNTSFEVTGLTPGEQVTIIVEAISGNACGNTSAQLTCTAQDCPTVEVTIDPVADICLDASAMPIILAASQTGGVGGGSFTFSGPGVNPITGEFDPAAANLGTNTIQVTYEEGTCTYNGSTTITVNPQPTADFTVTTPICEDNSSTVNYTGTASSSATFTWDFAGGAATPGTGPGPHTVVWADAGSYQITLQVDENDCASEMSMQTVDVDALIPEPDVTCDASTSSVEFFWTNVPGADSYSVTVLAGSGGVMTSDTSMLFDGLVPNTVISIEITANGTTACGPTTIQANCEAQDCPGVGIDIDPVADICLDTSAAPVDLAISITGGAGGGTTIVTGPGIISPTGTFDPAVADIGANQITVTYTEGNCVYTETITINVSDLPVASFTADSPICETDESTVTFDGVVEPGLIFTWDFGNGTAVPGTGQGPHTVTWPDIGPQTISLILENSTGCVADAFTQDVQVDEPLIAPNISCSSTTTSIEFSWPDVVGAVDYGVNVLTGQAGTFDPVNNTYLVDNLSPNDVVTIELTVTGGGACPPVTVEETCIAVDCPPLDVIIDPVPGICLTFTVPTQLVATPAGGTWSGPGVIDPVNGIFDPQAAGVGDHVIVYTYEDGPCMYDGQTIINVFGEPSAEFSASPNICVTDVAIVEYIGNAASTATYNWDFGGGNSIPGTGPGPHTVTWPADGNYTISLSVEQDGCVSQTLTQDVQVDAELVVPIIGCDVSVSSVTFDWNDVVGATDYEVTVISGASGDVVGNTYQVNGLVPGDEICIELTVSGDTECGPVSVQHCCTAEDCPPVSLALDPIGPFCFDATTPATPLSAVVTGGSGMGTGVWSGPGVNVSTGEFDPSVAGVGTHVIVYEYEENANCTYSETITVIVVPPPVADAGVDAELTCLDDQMDATLGGVSSTGPNITYEWSVQGGGQFPGDSTVFDPVVAVAGTYILTVTNTDLGCSSTDEVEVVASQDLPNAEILLTPVSCYGEEDGVISITGVAGGVPPYMYSLSGSPYGSASSFTNLSPGAYTLGVLDANGCESMITLDISQPQEVDVELVVIYDGQNNTITLGDAAELAALSTIPEDSLELIAWEPSNAVDCDSCLNVVVEPTQQTTYSITIGDNGCTDSDAITLFVSKDYGIYVPNAFSPNDDGTNDFFLIYADENEVATIKSFLVFSRWGETVHQYFNFPPNQAEPFGWDGRHRGQLLNPAVFTWFAEVEFIDGRVELFEGDVTLTR